MKSAMRAPATLSLALFGALMALPLWAMSLDTTGPAPALPDGARGTAAPLALETWAAGSAALVPLMAVDAPARTTPMVDTPADDTGGTVGKPLDDLAFVRKAVDSGHKEVAAARDALPQLKN